jgi:regulation of enolase protein 1 (concanavalin A-like superfamily)
MPVITECPSCGRKVRLRDDSPARAVRCPACGTAFPVDAAEEAALSARPLPPPMRARVVDEDAEERPPLRDRRRRGRSQAAPFVGLVLGIVALVIALGALAVSWVPYVNLAGLACGMLGIFLAFLGMVLAIVRGRYGLMLAPLAGGVLNLVALTVIGVFLVTNATGDPAGGLGELVRPSGDWGRAIDPDGDCTIRPGTGRLTITVPGTAHDLSAELGQVNAPRVMQDVSGDFTVWVKVVGTLRPAPAGTIPGRLPFHGAGLLLWQDRNTYVRLERAAVNRDGIIQPYGMLELRLNGAIGSSLTMPIADADTHLRLERRGNTLLGAVSQDGVAWNPFDPMTVALPPAVQVGVDAVNSSAQPLKVQFEEFKLTRAAGR